MAHRPLVLVFVLLWVHAASAQVPLIDLGAGTYQGFAGGLYPGGVNLPPAAHAQLAIAAAATVVPRDAAGQPDPEGRIVLLSIGMSNTNQEFQVFERDADRDPARNALVVIVNGAVGGQSAEIIRSPTAGYWNVVSERLSAAGVTAAQVQVAWIKEAQGTLPTTRFPDHALNLKNDLRAIATLLHSRFPNLRLAYLSSRIYGGYTTNPQRGEPLSYETGFAVRWLIEDQMSGDPGLNPDPAAGPVAAPVLLWGPYLWANGTTPRSDGLTYERADIESDGVHPAPGAERKVGDLLGRFFAGETSARPWLGATTAASLVTLDAVADATLDGASPTTPLGTSPDLIVAGGNPPSLAYLRFDAAAVSGRILHAKLSVRNESQADGMLGLVGDSSWDEASITFANAPPVDQTIGTIPLWSRDSALGHDVTTAVVADADKVVTFALSRTNAQRVRFLARETGEPPRLVLSVAGGTTTTGGRVPDGAALAGEPLRAVKSPTGVTLSWGASCRSADSDYAVYEGTIGTYPSHLPLTCTTGGALAANVSPAGTSAYLLVVPHDAAIEGYHGIQPPGPATCLAIAAMTCP